LFTGCSSLESSPGWFGMTGLKPMLMGVPEAGLRIGCEFALRFCAAFCAEGC
jgi:hypothetical protein